MDTQIESKMDSRTDSRIRLLLRILRNPLVSILVLYYALDYVRSSGITYMLSPIIIQSQVQTLIVGVLIVANLLLVYASFVYFVERRSVSELALPPMGRELGIGLLLGFGLMTVCFLIAMALGLYRIEGLNWQNLVIGVTGASLVVPISEELMFRGVVFRILEGLFGGWLALVLSSVVFGLVHSGNSGETFLGVASIAIVYGPMLAAPYMLTRRLWMGMGIHIAWNYTMGKVFSGSVSGTSQMQGLFKSTFAGPELLTGGSAGMEGSLIAMLVGIAFTVVVLILVVRRGKIVPPSWKHKHLA